MSPSIGRTVHYRITAGEAEKTNARRDDARANLNKMREDRPGFQAHVGNPLYEGDAVPMVITAVWPTSVNGQAFLDGNDSLWVTSAEEGEGPGTWSWPTMKKE